MHPPTLPSHGKLREAILLALHLNGASYKGQSSSPNEGGGKNTPTELSKRKSPLNPLSA